MHISVHTENIVSLFELNLSSNLHCILFDIDELFPNLSSMLGIRRLEFSICYRGAFYLLIVCRFTHPPLMISHKSSIYFHSRLTLELIVATSISDYSSIYNRGGSSWGDYCFHNIAHSLCVTDDIRYYHPRYYHIFRLRLHRYIPLIIFNISIKDGSFKIFIFLSILHTTCYGF